MTNKTLLMTAIIFCCSCASYKTVVRENENTTQTGTPYHSIYLIANTDIHDEQGFPSLSPVLSKELSEKPKQKTILMLGNNALKNAVPDTANKKLDDQLISNLKTKYNFVDEFKGDIYFIPGQNEWDKGSAFGQQQVRLTEFYTEEVLELGDLYRPSNACPGPEEIHLNEDVVLLLIDTQWLLHNWDKPNEEDGCDVNNNLEFYTALDDAIKRHYNKKIIVAGHHSLYSSGKHAGNFPIKRHIFPIVNSQQDFVHVPLPGLGSIYVAFRSVFGSHQDLSNYQYKRVKEELLQRFRQHKNLTYVSGHEMSLEYFEETELHLINSGSFSTALPIGKSDAEFASSTVGYGKINLYENGDVKLQFFSNNQEKPIYETLLYNQERFDEEEFEELKEQLDYTDSVTSAYASLRYGKKNDKPGPFGNNYRDVWSTVVNGIRYFDLEKEKGGMEIDKKGGGMQTKSLRLEAADEKEYVLRSVEKYPENAVPLELRGTFAEDLIAEQISSSHPYAAFVVPDLADAAGVYHTNPELVYLPDDPRLGIYRENFGGDLYLYEERPDDDRSDVKSFGRPKEIVSTEDLIKKLLKDGDHEVDQELVVRSRLFDILIGDWDRHDDQWRWAKYRLGGEDEIKFYQPIPRDRDQVFFWSDGWVMDLISRRWAMPKFQGFHMEVRDIEGFSFNARHFDRTFMNETTLEDWVRISRELQDSITDQDIESAIKKFPPEIYPLHGDTIIAKLKQRKQDLEKYARQYYLFLAKEVDVWGSSKRELFEIERINDEETKITSYRIKNKSDEIKYKSYERTFKTSETNEIRIYLLGDDDIVRMSGIVDEGIKIRIIGGGGDDVITNQSKVRGLAKKTWVYDVREDTKLVKNKDTKDKTTDRNPDINLFERKTFEYDILAPLLYGGYNPDDGLFLGIGGYLKTHGFRKDPFASQHFIVGNIAPKSASFNISYRSTYTDLFGKWDANLNAGIFYPSYSDFFYGLGNETESDEEKREEDSRYYATRFQQIRINPEIFINSRNQRHKFLVGTSYRLINIKESLNRDDDDDEERFINQYLETLDYPVYNEPRNFINVYGEYSFDTRDNELYPKKGLFLSFKNGFVKDIDHHPYEVEYTYARSQASIYHSFGNTLKTTFAARVGGAINEGNYEFYQANTLGGAENLRGFRRDRFSGDISFFQNTELRIRLFNFRTIVLPGDFGITLFHDIGRVWMEEDPSTVSGESDLWHRGFGGGFFVAPFGKAALNFDYSFSNSDESAFFVRIGFLF